MLLAGALVSTAQLMVIALRANMAAQRQSTTSTLAQEKLEQLRGLAWGFDELGLPTNDFSTDLTVEPAVAIGGVGLTPSPGDALASNMTGYVDYLDRYGASLGGGPTPPAGAVYVRRWSVEPLPTNPNNTIVIQVLVSPMSNESSRRPTAGNARRRMAGDALLTSVKTRKAS